MFLTNFKLWYEMDDFFDSEDEISYEIINSNKDVKESKKLHRANSYNSFFNESKLQKINNLQFEAFFEKISSDIKNLNNKIDKLPKENKTNSINLNYFYSVGFGVLITLLIVRANK